MSGIRSFFPNDSKDSKEKIIMSKANCVKCGLDKTCITPRMKMTGEGKKEIFILAESPGADEDEYGKQLVGEAGQLLRKTLKKYGIELDKDCWKINCVNCFISPKVSVYTSEGCKKITDVKVGDLVLTHKGRFRKVLSRIHDLPLEKRKNKELLVDIVLKDSNSKYNSNKTFKQTVTARHSFLVNNKWVEAQCLSSGDKLKVLGSVCEVCGKIYFKPIRKYDFTENTCSQKCHNVLSGSKSGKAISKSLFEQYTNGTRIGSKITEKAHAVAKRKKSWKTMINENNRRKGDLTKAKRRETLDHIKRPDLPGSIGKGERTLAKYFKRNNISFISQFAVKEKNYDFYLPEFDIIIEIDGNYKYRQMKTIKGMELKTKLVESEGYDLIRLPSKETISAFERIIKNHNGKYIFTELEVVGTTIRKQKRQEYLYCLEVDEDNSFIAKNGEVHHNCRPPNNREPTDKEIRCCRPMVEEALLSTKPKIIILLGNKALQNFFFGMISKKFLSISNWTHHCIPDHRYGAWVLPSFHPSALLHNQDENLQAIFESDLKFAVSCLDLDPPVFDDPDKSVKVLTKVNDVLDAIYDVRQSGKLFFDYETSGLKPYTPGHKVYSIAIAGEGTPVFSFPYQYVHWKEKEFEKIKRAFIKLLLDESVEKIAQNMKFENKWSKCVVGAQPTNWIWCTMTTQHLIDARRSMTRLDVQALIYYGQRDWGTEISPFKESVGKDGFNTMHKAPLLPLLKYGGYDIFYTRKRYYDQVPFMKKHKRISKCNDLFFSGLLALSESEDVGIGVNAKYYRDKTKELEESLKQQEILLRERGSGLLFKKKYKREIDIQSSKDLRLLFYDILGLQPTKVTKKGFESVDEYSLTNMEAPFAKALIKYRKTKKMFDYVSEYDRINDGDRIHPSFDLNHAATGRSNSSSPNLQNVPVRDEAARNMIRGGIIPTPGNIIMEADYSQIEVRIMACYSEDPVLISYIMDKSKDMHRDQAMQIFKLPEKEVTKPIRHIGKNDFVFPQFYGDYYEPCAKSAYEDCVDLKTASGVPILEHLKKVGLGNYEKFKQNMKVVENNFWRKLKVTMQWRNNVVLQYRKKTYVDTFFGFRRDGYMVKNQITNTPVQGTSFHCLLWSYVRVSNILKQKGFRTKLVGEVHDSILLDTFPKEKEEVITIVKQVMEKDIVEEHKRWLIVPLAIEIEMTEIDQPWSTKK